MTRIKGKKLKKKICKKNSYELIKKPKRMFKRTRKEMQIVSWKKFWKILIFDFFPINSSILEYFYVSVMDKNIQPYEPQMKMHDHINKNN